MGAHERNVSDVKIRPTDVANVAGVVHAKRGRARVFKGIFTDTRFPVAGGVFFGFKGEKHDGSLFANDAIKAGARAVVVKNDTPLPKSDVHVFYHADPLFAFGELARAHREGSGASVVAIAGSLGKTTVKEMVGRIFRKIIGKNYVVMSEGNLNNLVGVPLNVFRLKKQRVAIFELGTSRIGELARLTRIVEPDFSVITAVAPVHLEFFGDINGVLKAKWELVEATAGDARVVLNRDDELLVGNAKRIRRKIIWFGTHSKSDVKLADLSLLGFDGSKLTVWAGNETATCTIKAAGRHQAKNALCALAIAYAYGLKLRDAADALSGFEPFELRGRVMRRGKWTVIDDSYNASPEAVKQALEMLAFGSGKKVAVIGHMRELGESSRQLHFEVGQFAAKNSDVLIAVGELSDEIKRGAILAGMDESRVFCAADWREALDVLLKAVKSEATILVKASRLVGLDRLVKALGES